MHKFLHKFRCLPGDILAGQHNFRADELVILLTNAVPLPEWQTINDVPQVAETDIPKPPPDAEPGTPLPARTLGYTAGGNAVRTREYQATHYVAKVTCEPVVFAAGDEPIGPFRFVIIANKTKNRLIAYHDCGGEDVIDPGHHLEVDFSTDGIFSQD